MMYMQTCCRFIAQSASKVLSRQFTLGVIALAILGQSTPALGQQTCMPANPCPAGCSKAFGSVGLDYRACLPGGSFNNVVAWPVVAGEQIQYAVRVRKDDPEACNFHSGQLRLFFPNGQLVQVAGYPTENSPPVVPDVAVGFPFLVGIVGGTPSFQSTLFTIPVGPPGSLTSPVEYGTTGCPAGQQLCGIKRDMPGTRDVSASTSVTVNRAVPCINVVKHASITGLCEGVPAPVRYTYTVTNCSSSNTAGFPLTMVVVVDDHCPMVIRDADSPGNNDNNLELGEVWKYHCDSIISTTTTNVVTASGLFVTPGAVTPVMDTDSATVTATQRPTIEVMGAQVCAGTTSAQMCATVTGGTPPYTVNWYAQGNPGTILFTCQIASSGGQCCAPSLPAGSVGEPITYCAQVIDSKQCVDEDCGNIVTNPNRMVIVPDVTVCAQGGAIPDLCATVSGGLAPYVVDWVNQNAPNVILHTCAIAINGGSCCFSPSVVGTYIAKATDARMCRGQDAGTVIVNPPPLCNVENPNRTICAGTSTTFVARPHGGTAPYTVVWRNPNGDIIATCQNVAELGSCTTPPVSTPGVYCASVTDVNGCIGGPCCGTLSVAPNPSISIQPNRICAGANSGQLCAQVSGGTPNYTVQFYLNDTPVQQPCVINTPAGNCCRNLPPGTYTARVIDANGCMATTSGTLSVNPNPEVEVMGEFVCAEEPTGQICAMVTNGDPPYHVRWYVQGAPAVTVANCEVATDGGQCCVNLPPGPPGSPIIYCAEAVDRKNCIGVGCGTLSSTPARLVNVNDRQVCEGQPLPPLCAVVSGGVPPYDVNWVSASAPNIVLFSCRILFSGGQCCYTPELPGTYIAKVVDSAGCFSQDHGTLTVNPLPVCSLDEDMDTVCQGESSSFIARASGGTAPYTITWWGPNGFSKVCTNLSAGQACSTGLVNVGGLYCVTVTDAKGCVNAEACCAKLLVSPRPACEVDPCTAQLCPGDEPLLIEARGIGGAGGPYTFHWNGPNGFSFDGPSILVTVPGVYCARATDAAGCLGADLCCAVVLDGTISCYIQPPAEQPLCGSIGNQLHAIVNGLKPPYFYHWDLDAPGCGWEITEGQGTPTITYTTGCVNTRGDFTLTVMDLHGCASTCTINITCLCPPGEEIGCPSTYWKSTENLSLWASPYCPGVGINGCVKATKFMKVFECGSSTAAVNAFHGKTLLQVAGQSGSGCKALGRETVAALLNAAAYGPNFSSTFDTPAKVIAKFNKTMKKNGGYPTAAQINSLRIEFRYLNSQGCPSNNQGNGAAAGVPAHSPDLNNDGKVDQADLAILMSQWGQSGTADFNGDGLVGPSDLSTLLRWWGW